MGQSTYYSSHLETVDSRSLPSVYLSAPLSTVPTGSNLTLGAITKKKVSCYPLMTFIGVKSAVLFTPSRVLRTRRNDYKLRCKCSIKKIFTLRALKGLPFGF